MSPPDSMNKPVSSPSETPRRSSSLSFNGEKTQDFDSPDSGTSPSSRSFADVEAQTPNASGQASQDPEPVWPTEWRAYACLFGGFLLMFNSWGLVNAYGTFASYYKQHLLPGRDAVMMNLVGSTQSFVVLVLSFVVGRVLDAGHTRSLIAAGAFLVTFGTSMLSISNGDAQYNGGNYGLVWLTQGFISGLGMACFFVSSSQVVATWFKQRKGFAIGVVASGASIAGLIYPMMTKFLITEVGFNDAVRYVATLIGVTSTLAVFIARPKPTHHFRKPESWARLSVWVDMDAFRTPAFNWFTAAICFMFFGFYAVFFNLEKWAAAAGFGYKDQTPAAMDIGLQLEVPKDAIRTFWLLSIMNAASTLGRLSSAYLADYFGALNVHTIVTLIASMLILVLWILTTKLAAAIAFVVVFGVFSGSVIGMPPASMAYILGHCPHAQARLGQWTGMMYSISAVFALTGPVIAGHLVDAFGNGSDFLSAQIWSGICLFLSACCMAVAAMYARRGDQGPDFSNALSSTSDTAQVRGSVPISGTETNATDKENENGITRTS
ncbi:hypothetical protein LTR50_000681 [Elasticomyces elasticus]|nr:hypothetical protein LTR50_000681 [Elasticomyces elasticus]